MFLYDFKWKQQITMTSDILRKKWFKTEHISMVATVLTMLTVSGGKVQ